MNKKQTSLAGFTLIELLVVIVIIAILAAILFPAFVEVKKRAVQQQCLGNLSQLGKAMILYTDDNNQAFPPVRVGEAGPEPEGNWVCAEYVYGPVQLQRSSLYKYVKTIKVFSCTTDQNRIAENILKNNKTEPNLTTFAKKYPLSYSMNYLLSFRTVSSMPRIKNMLLFIHESRETINDGDFAWGLGVDMPDDVHYNGTTVAYIDGHTQWQSYKELKKARNLGIWSPIKGHWANTQDPNNPRDWTPD